MYKTIATCFTLLLAASFLFPSISQAQDLHPSRRPSPLGMARTFVGNTYVKVTFSQPYMRGRDNIFGEKADSVMHAYGELWRFGANEPTELTIDGSLNIGGTEVSAGTYSVFVTPGAESWMMHLNDLRGGNAGQYDANKNVVSVALESHTASEEVDQFTIRFVESDRGVHMEASWTDWEIRLPIMPLN